MKTIGAYKNCVLVLLLSFFAVTGAFAQLSLGFDVAFPVGDFGTNFSTGFGGSLRYDGTIDSNLSWTVTGGYQTFAIKNAGGGSANTSMIPIMGGVKYYFQGESNGLYGGADVGLVFASVGYSIGGFSGSANETRFGLSPALGYRSGSFDISAKYNLVSDLNNFGFRIAYFFGAP